MNLRLNIWLNFLRNILSRLTIFGFVTIYILPLKSEPYKKSDFNRLAPGNLNISVYTFHDRNKNGSYDLGDLPMAGIQAELKKPDGMIVNQTSNKNGYINFKMALGSPSYRHINKDGEIYIFEVLEPPNWQITTKNQKQEILFLRKIGSPGGLVADEAPNWVGLAPDLTIKGKITAKNIDLPKDIILKAINPYGNKKNIKIGKDGLFIINAEKGKWKLLFKSKSQKWEKTKIINVNYAPIVLMNINIGENNLPISGREVIENFDWIKYSNLEKIPDGHLGLNWNYLLAMNNKSSRGPGYINVLNSGNGIGYSSSGHPVTIESLEGERFDFIGGYFTVAWSKANGEILKIEAFRKDKKDFSNQVELSYLGPKWLEIDIRNIDKLVLSTVHYWQFAAEDLHFRVQNK